MKDRGFSIVEVLAGAMVLGVSTYFVVYCMLSQRILLENQQQLRLLKALVQDNVYELETRGIAELPATGNCLIRTYDTNKVLTATQTVPAADSSCQVTTLSAPGYRIVWISEASDKINVVFNPSAFLKLPKYVQTVRQLQVKGGYKPPLDGTVHQVALTVFRR